MATFWVLRNQDVNPGNPSHDRVVVIMITSQYNTP
jgi:hypothetical protein